jgi:hypothetical protein
MSEHRGGFFSWFFGRETGHDNPTKGRARRPGPTDLTNSLVANEAMLRGLYHGDYKGLQFASPLTYPPIAIPVNMMGLPTPTSEDSRTQEVLDEITAQMAERISMLNRSKLLFGTAWRWPHFDAGSGELVWDEIGDSIVSDILIDLRTGKPSAILTDEQIAISIAENQVAYVQRKRRFDVDQVAVQWFGQKSASVQDYTARNVAGTLPITFAHDTDEGEIRGHSSLARVSRQLKDYHDIDFRISETLAKFRPKQKQKVKNLAEWLKNNFGSDNPEALTSLDIADNDFILNVEGEETAFEFLPEGATSGHEKALERKFLMIVEGSGIPELAWGPLATGNHASTDEDKQLLISYVDDLRRESNRPYYDLYAASLRLLSIVRGENYKPFKMGWNKLESVSADMKSQIFARFAQALTQMSGAAAMTVGQMYKLWSLNYPETEPGTFDEFVAGITQMGLHKQFVGLDYASGLADFQGGKAGAMGDTAGQGALGTKGVDAK